MPTQTFSTLQQLIDYFNAVIVANGVNSITGPQANNSFNGLASFIKSYTVNNGLAAVSSSSGAVALSKPITIFTAVPSSIGWSDNVQEEYYIINATGLPLPILSGLSFTDSFGTQQTTVIPNDAVHIAKATNGTWFRINNISGAASGGLPPEAGNGGKSLFNNGTTAFWADGVLQIPAGDANYVTPTKWVNGHSYTITLPSSFFLMFWNETNRFMLRNTSPVEYDFNGGTGFNVFVPGFDGSVNNLFLFFKSAA